MQDTKKHESKCIDASDRRCRVPGAALRVTLAISPTRSTNEGAVKVQYTRKHESKCIDASDRRCRLPGAALQVAIAGICLLLTWILPTGWSPAKAAKLPVIVLPGFMGSTLVDRSNRVTLVYGRFRGIVEDFQKLKLPADLKKIGWSQRDW